MPTVAPQGRHELDDARVSHLPQGVGWGPAATICWPQKKWSSDPKARERPALAYRSYTPLITFAVIHDLCVGFGEILSLVESLFCLAGNQVYLLAHPLLADGRRLGD